jgi:O-methyltransferase
MWELLKSGLRFTIDELGYRSIARKYRGRTMVPATAFVANLRLAALVRNIPGDIVECGTWRGGMSAGMADVLGPDRHYRLFDSYEGMPAAQPIDGAAAMAWEKNTSAPEYHNKCRASEAEARQSMAMSRAKHVSVIKGWFHDTLPQTEKRPIALLRLDADWYDSTISILENFADLVVPGGILIVDDYGMFEGCTKAINEWAAKKTWVIRDTRLGDVCYIRL